MLQSDEASPGDDDITFCPSFSSYGCGCDCDLSWRRFVFVVVGLVTSLLLFMFTFTAALVVQSLVSAVAAGDESAATLV